MLVILFQLASGLSISMIPITGTPPERLKSAESVYDPIENRIISFGGQTSDNTYISTISYFSLSSKTWTYPTYESLIIPPGLINSKLALRSDRKLLAFFGSKESGISSNVYSYDLNTDFWSIETLNGDTLLGITNYASDSFSYNNTHFIAIFGGITKNGVSDNLYLIEINTLKVKKMPQLGYTPPARLYSSLVYYNEKLYMYGGNLNTVDTVTEEIFEYSLSLKTWKILTVNGSKPSSRLMHKATIYKDSMWIFYGLSFTKEFRDIWKFNFTTCEWSLILNNSNSSRTYCSTIRINDSFYLLFGKNVSYEFNSIDLYTFSDNSLSSLQLTYDWEFPPARKGHCSIVLSDKLYLFGGLSSTGVYLNDMWTFDFSLNLWTELETTGNIPSPRSSFSCVKYGAMIIGIGYGRDSTNLFNDFYSFDTFSKNWRQLTRNGPVPDPRFGTCICLYDYYAFTIGGQNFDMNFDDLWVYNYFTNSYVLVNASLPIKLSNHICWATSNGSGYDIYIIGGNEYNKNTNSDFYKVSLTISSVISFKSEIIYSSLYLANSENAFILIDDMVFLLFGAFYDLSITSNIVSLNYKTLQLTVYNSSSVSGSFGHSAVHYKDSIYVFGGIPGFYSYKIYNAPTNRFIKISLANNEDSFTCSSGTIKPDCKPCTAGTYYLDDLCALCPKGTFSRAIALNDISQCIPCNFNSFTEKQGSTYCLDCPENSFCPIGSSIYKSSIKLPDYQNNQPSSYTASSSLTDKFMNYALIGFLSTIGIMSLLLLSYIRVQKIIEKADCFIDKHSQILNKPVVYKKTVIGGFFSVLFFIVALLVIAFNIIGFIQDNISESRSLVPVSTIKEKIIADTFEIEVIYYYYGAECGKDDICSIYTKISETGVDYSLRSMTCKIVSQTCVLNLKYFGFSSSQQSSITISQIDFLAFASYISVNVSISSSIPQEVSNIFIPITPSPIGTSFKGRNPTKLYYELTPAIFTTDSNDWDNFQTGYHILDNQALVLGDVVTQSTFYSDHFVVLQLDLTLGSSGFLISRNLKSTFFVMVGAVLGSIFGLAGSIAAIMSIFEGLVTWAAKMSLKKTKKNLLSQRRKIQSLLNNVPSNNAPRRCYYIKVYPQPATPNETFTN